MRTGVIALLLLLLVCAPIGASGSTILFSSSDESRIEYGTEGLFYIGLPAFQPLLEEIDGIRQDLDWEVSFYGYQVFGSFVRSTFDADANGTVVRSAYYYDGLPFDIHFTAENVETGETRQGDFVAPIAGLIEVLVEETYGPESSDHVQISFLLGPGLFDEGIARALNIRRRTIGGRVFDPYLTFGDGEPDSPERFAWEGASDLTIDVAEPGSAMLFLLGVGAFARSRKRHPARAPVR